MQSLKLTQPLGCASFLNVHTNILCVVLKVLGLGPSVYGFCMKFALFCIQQSLPGWSDLALLTLRQALYCMGMCLCLSADSLGVEAQCKREGVKG